MTAFLSRIYWTLRGRRRVRLQLDGDKGAVDGIFLGTIAGHYRLVNCYFYTNQQGSQGIEMPGETWVAKSKVLLLNVKTT